MKTYIGDGVYAEKNAFHQVVLTTEDGVCATNTIYLEPEVVEALVCWLRREFTLPAAEGSVVGDGQ